MARVFVSHASADLATAVEIQAWLQDAGHLVFLDRDPSSGIQLGEQWKRRLYKELRAADAVVCVVTEAFQNSAWCSAEVWIADMLGRPLLPVRAGAGVASSLLEGLDYVDAHADPARARSKVVQRLRAIDAAGGSGWVDGRSPYPGLKPFDADMTQVFRGRSVEVRELAGRQRSLGERAEGSLLVVVGPSGCGKSSLVRAGLVPVMGGEAGWQTVVPFTPGTNPVAALGRALTITAKRAGVTWTVGATTAELADGADGLARLADELLLSGPGPERERLLVVVDQGEELLTRADPAGLAQFWRLLGAGLAGPVRAVVTLRSEFLDRLRAVPELAEVDVDTFLLRPLDEAMLRVVVAEPAAVAGLRLDGELADRLVADTAGGDALPLLAFTLAELARGKTCGDELSAQDYADLGGVQGALARHADASLVAASTASGLDPTVVLAGLTRLATLDTTGQTTRRQIPSAGVEKQLQAALTVFVDNRLLVTTSEAGEAQVGVAHEALLTSWRPLAAALDARKATLIESRTVEQAAATWQDNDRAGAYLWGGARLTAALVALDVPAAVDDTLPDRLACLDGVDASGREFLAASAGHALTARGHARRRRTATLTTLSVLLLAAVTALVYSSFLANSLLTRSNDLKRVRDLTELGRSAAGLTTMLQSERTFTVGFVADRSAGAPSDISPDINLLSPIRQDTDARLAEFRRAVTSQGESFAPDAQDAIASAIERLGRLDGVRAAMTASPNADSARIAYTTIIDGLVDLIELVPQGEDDASLTNTVRTTTSLALANELLASQQALAYGLVFLGTSDNVDSRAFLAFDTAREQALTVFRQTATREQIQMFDDTVKGVEVQLTEDYSEIVLARQPNEPIDIEPERWLQATTKTISMTAQAVGSLFDTISTRNDELRADIQPRALLFGLLVVVILATTALTATLLARLLVRSPKDSLEPGE